MLTKLCGEALSVILLLAVLSCTPYVSAQETAGSGSDSSPSIAQSWRDFIHYIKIARPEAALAYGKALVDAKPDPRVVYRLSVETEDVVGTLARGERLEGLADTIERLRELVEEGYRQESRDPAQIAKAIEMLTGNLRQQSIARDRLKASGEYAVPQLIHELSDSKASLLLRNQISSVLSAMGRPSVRPLCAALASPNAGVRAVVCLSLGKIGYWHAAPALRAVLDDPNEAAGVKEAAAVALATVTVDRTAASKPVAGYYYELAEKYYTNQDSIQPDRRFATANVWYWQKGLGLTYKEVPIDIFLEVYAMRSARQALADDSRYYPAVSLWLAANLRKESRLPAGQRDPTRGEAQMGAGSHARAAGAKYAQEVLARALEDKDVAVATGAIRALAVTAGAANLVKPAAGGVTPLVAALSFPDRRVRFMAAEAVANARPLDPFVGSELVMSVLVDALRQTGRPTALLIEPDSGMRNKLKDMIRRANYDVVDAEQYSAGAEAVSETTGVDVAVIGASITSPGPREALQMLRADPMMAALSVVFVAGDASLASVRRLARDDEMVTVVSAADMDMAAVHAGLKAAGDKTVSDAPMGEQEAAQWAKTAAEALRMLGLTRTPVFELLLAERALIDGLSDARDEQKVACARALAVLTSGRAQQAIVDLAGSKAPQPVRIAAYRAAAESVRLIGNQLDEARSAAVVDVVDSDAPEAIRYAAGELLGALDLPSEQIRSLIIRAE